MNKMYNDNKEYNTALDSLHFSEEAKARMVQNLLDAGEQPQAARRTRRLLPRVAAVGIAAALVLGVGAGATGVFKSAGEAFSGLFGTAHTEIIDKIGRPVGASDTANGVTITADAIIGDKYSYAITYTIAKDDGTPFDVDFAAIEGTDLLPLRFAESDTDIGFMGGMHGTTFFRDDDPTDNAIQYVEMKTGDSALRTGRAKTTFADLYVGSGEDERLLAEGKWTLKYDFAFEDTSIDLPAGQRFNLNGMDAVLDEITLSPVAIQVAYTVNSEVQWSDAPSGKLPEQDAREMERYFESLPIVLTRTDGTTIDLSNAGGSIEPENGKTICQKGEMFEQIIPLDELASLTIGGVEIEIG